MMKNKEKKSSKVFTRLGQEGRTRQRTIHRVSLELEREQKQMSLIMSTNKELKEMGEEEKWEEEEEREKNRKKERGGEERGEREDEGG